MTRSRMPARHDRRMPPAQHRRRVALPLLAVALVVAVGLSLMLGGREISVTAFADAIIAPGTADQAAVIWGLRLPRTVVGILAGAGFAVAGALIQAVSRNPLAEPGIVGVSAGAGFAVTLAAAVWGIASPSAVAGTAFAGALLTTAVVLAIGRAGRPGGSARMLLAGVAIAAILGGLSTAISLRDSTAFTAVRNWALGSIVATGYDEARVMGLVIAAGVVLAFVCAPGLNALALGDELATALGTRAAWVRGAAVVAIALTAGGATALTGGIVFLGLMVPHAMRWVVGPDQRGILATSLLAGPALVLVADVIGRLIAAPGEIPVGVVVAVVGAPVLIAMVRRREVSGL
ncbi:iron complex transport system permease protein [Microbacterium sp. SORGH_AS 1204]|nr:iron complex transport system permease protein [Microbacterium sp. SORGH_AS_1204]